MKQTNLQKIQERLRVKFIKIGVKMVAPETVYFSKDTKIGKNVTIEPYVVFGEKVKIQNNSKIKSFSHGEFNQEKLNTKIIEKKILENEDIFGRGNKLEKVYIDNSFPKYITKNKDKLSDWII